MNVCVQNDEMESLRAVNVIHFLPSYAWASRVKHTQPCLERLVSPGMWVTAACVLAGFNG